MFVFILLMLIHHLAPLYNDYMLLAISASLSFSDFIHKFEQKEDIAAV